MEAMISSLVSRFERGALTRRELVQGLTMLGRRERRGGAQTQRRRPSKAPRSTT